MSSITASQAVDSNRSTGGRLARTRWAAIGAACAVSLGAGSFGVVRAVVDNGDRAVYVPVTPARVLDTRSDVGATIVNDAQPVLLTVTGTVPVLTSSGVVQRVVVPDGASGVVVNVTAVAPERGGYVSLRPGDATGSPDVSTLNVTPGGVFPNGATLTLPTTGAAAGKVQIWYEAESFTGGSTDLLIDVVGYYVDHNHDDRYYTRDEADEQFAQFNSIENLYRSLDALEEQTRLQPAGAQIGTIDNSYNTGFHIDATTSFDGRGVLVDRAEPMTGGPGILRYFRCDNFNCSSYGHIDIDDLGGDPMEPSVELNSEGNPLIVYYDNAAPYGLRLIECLDRLCGSRDEPLVVTTGLDDGRNPEITNVPDGASLIAYRVGSGASAQLKVKRVVCQPYGGCTFTNDGFTAANGGYDPSFVIGPDGIPFVLHFRANGSNSQLILTKCGDVACNTNNEIQRAMGPTGGDAVLTANGTVLAVGSWGNSLYLLGCRDRACMVINNASIPNPGKIIDNVTLSLGQDGYVLGAFSTYDGVDQKLHYFRCTTVDCLDGSFSFTIDQTTLAASFEPRGLDADIVVTANGYPVVFDRMSTSGGTPNSLGITSCSNRYCLARVRLP